MLSDYLKKDVKRASCALIFNKEGKVLTVSRKFDHDDKGLPGGKVEDGETFEEACIREIKEETNLEITELTSIFGNYCRDPDGEVKSWAQTFICKVKGNVSSSEEGIVTWENIERITRPNCSFSVYNLELQEAIKITNIDIRDWINHV